MKMLLPLCFLALLPLAAQADDASLEDCQAWYQSAERYQAYLLKGGPSTWMEGWKKKIDQFEEKMHSGNCRKYGRQISLEQNAAQPESVSLTQG